MTDPTLDIEDMLALNDDPRFIDGIFNYCHRRCDRCPFTDRCRLYADEKRDDERYPTDDWQTRVQRSFQRTVELLRRWCKREGIDYEKVEQEANAQAVKDELERMEETRRDPLLRLAERYTFTAMKLAQVLRTADRFARLPSEAIRALDTIEWCGIRVSSKVHRAIGGYERRSEDESADDAVQSDWNGSAKVARIDIAESRAAWETILCVGEAPEDSPLRQMIGLLDEIDAGVAQRFPDAMAFVRPGFDEPEVAAGALTTLACFEPRPRR